MSFEVRTLPNFEREAKRLNKKHRSLKKDLQTLIESLEKSPEKGEHLAMIFIKYALLSVAKVPESLVVQELLLVSK